MSAPETPPAETPEPKLTAFEIAFSDTRSARKTAAKRLRSAVVQAQWILAVQEEGSVPEDRHLRRLARMLRKAYDGIVFVGETFDDLAEAYRSEQRSEAPPKVKTPLPPNIRAVVDAALANPLGDDT
jgi:hypothetical protein